MRKKYLSALLFGALLFASAGTFTSCKDYDDDINNLQEQINTINTTLSELKTLVGDGGVSSVTFDESTGVLTVVDADGTKTYTIKTTAGEVADVKITIEGQELKVNGETVGKVGDTVTVANGELTINGTATGIKVGEYSILDNQDAGTVTITLPDADGKMQTVVLAKASSSLTSLKFEKDGWQSFGAASSYYYSYNEKKDICWNVAATDKQDWAGPKGAVKRNDLLVGQINAINVQVTPASFNLGESGILSLKDSKGNEAPVKVSAVKNNLLLTAPSSRAGNTGSWMITIEMGEGITADNIGTAFDSKNQYSEGQNRKNENKLYALCVNGEPVSNYDITINTSTDKATSIPDDVYPSLSYVDAEGYVDNTHKLPLGETTDLRLHLNNINSNYTDYTDYIYDSYITFEGTNKSLAEARGISAEGMSITTTAASAGTEIVATIHYMDVTGKVATKQAYLTVATSAAASVAADDVKYVVMPTKITNDVAERIGNINITNLGKVFQSIDAATRQKVQSLRQLSIVEEAGQTGFLLTSDNNGILLSGAQFENYSYLRKADGTQWNQDANWNQPWDDDDLVDLATISLPVGYKDLKIAKDAKPGKYVLYLVAKDIATDDTQANELFRIKLNVEIALPAFTDLYNKVDANWSDGKFVARITPSGTSTTTEFNTSAILTMSSAYGPAVTNAETSRLSYLFSDNDCKYFSDLKSAYNGDKLNAVVNTNGIATLNKGVAYNGSKTALNVKELKDIVAYTSVFAGMVDKTGNSNYKFEYGTDVEAIQEAFTVTSAPYNAQVKAALQGVTLVNYANGTLKPANEPIQLINDGYMSALTFSNGKPNTGFGFALNGSYVSAKYTEPGVANELGSYSLDGYALWSPVYDKWQDKDVQVTPAVEQAGVNVKLDGTPQQYQVTGLATGQSTTVTFTLTDQTGFNYPLTVTVVK